MSSIQLTVKINYSPQGKLWDWDPPLPVSAFSSNSVKMDDSAKEKVPSEKWDGKGNNGGKGSTRPGTAIETSQIQLELDVGQLRPHTAGDDNGNHGVDNDPDRLNLKR